MTDQSSVPSNWFTGGAEYATYRPSYPTQVSSFLADLVPSTGLAVDVGCGTGQLSSQLANHFDRVIGVDPSESQVAAAVEHPNITYQVARAEDLPLEDSSVDLVTAAQSAHWFSLPDFYAEARRVGRDGALIALVSYGSCGSPTRMSRKGSDASTTTRSASTGTRSASSSRRGAGRCPSPSRRSGPQS